MTNPRVASTMASMTALLLLFTTPVHAQDKGAPAQSGNGIVATVNGKSIPQARLDILLRERIAQGQHDSPELRNFLKQQLINLELMSQESLKRGLDKTPEVAVALEMGRIQILSSAFASDYLRKNQASDATLRSEYDKIKAQQGDKEYRARHILVKTEDEAKEALGQLAKGGNFEKIAAEKSLDTGSKGNGGDLNWSPPGRYVKPFAEALTRLKKGETTRAPVQTQFGWHIIRMEDERPLKMPTFDEAKGQLVQMMSQQALQKVVAEMRSKAKITD